MQKKIITVPVHNPAFSNKVLPDINSSILYSTKKTLKYSPRQKLGNPGDVITFICIPQNKGTQKLNTTIILAKT